MAEKGVPNNILTWYVNLLKNRQVCAEVQGKSVEIRPSRGSPQGGVLSPLIWNLIVDRFLSNHTKGPVRVLGYADDILLYVIGVCPTTMGEIIQPVLDEVVQWGRDNGLSFNPSKTTAVLFRKFLRVRRAPKIQLDGVALELQDSFKYLGVEIQKNLNWLPHVSQRVGKCNSLLNKCRNIISRSWGLSPDKMEWLFRAVIQPKLSYGSVIWSGHQTKAIRAKLTRTQRLCLLSIIHPLRSAPTAGLEAMMGWLPLPLHVEDVGFNTFLRIKQQLDSSWVDDDGKGHVGIWKKKERVSLQGPIPMMNSIRRNVWHNANSTNRNHLKKKYMIQVYTDASKQGDNVGYAWAACAGDFVIEERIYSAKEIDIHCAETMAIREALSWIKELQSLDCAFRVISDSQSAITVLCGHEAKDYITYEAMTLLSQIKSPLQVIWTKGHSKNTGNELADALARVGAEEAIRMSYSSPFMPVSCKTLKKRSAVNQISYWQDIWDDKIDCRVSKLFVPVVGPKKSLHLSSNELQSLSQILTGHGLFRRHLRHWNEIDSISCSLCGEGDEDSWHLWKYCPALQKERSSTTALIKGGVPWHGAILKFFKCDKIKELFASNEALLTPRG